MKAAVYQVLNRRHVLILLVVLFTLAVLLAVLIISVPSLITSVSAAPDSMPICCTDRSERVVSLTFDTSGSNKNIRELAQILFRLGVKATFFITGDFADSFPESVQLLHNNGHEIMNMSDNISGLVSLQRGKAVKKINRCGDIIQAVTGNRPVLFRPPDGEYDQALLETVFELEMLPIKWDVDSHDKIGLDPQGIIKRVTSLAASGSIIRFNTDGDHTLEALPTVIETLRDRGYTFILVSDMVYTKDYAINRHGRQILMED